VKIYCCGCGSDTEARLTNGGEIYPHRNDLSHLPFWKCDFCDNYVGCHHKTKDRIKPLGNIPTKELRYARKKIHELFDPIWKGSKNRGGCMNRKMAYKSLSLSLGYEYHTAEIKTIEEARKVYLTVRDIRESLNY